MIRDHVKSDDFWKKLKSTYRLGVPIMRSMRLCDARFEGKTGFVWGSLKCLTAMLEKKCQQYAKRSPLGFVFCRQ